MDVELLVIEDCPHEVAAAALLRRALDDVGLGGVASRTVLVTDLEQAAALAFPGSPTFRVDGVDLFAGPGSAPAVACRVYETAAGPAGVPDLSALRQALKRAADLRRDPPRCGCCGRRRSRLTELGRTPGVFLCARCGLWAAGRAWGLPRLGRRSSRGAGC